MNTEEIADKVSTVNMNRFLDDILYDYTINRQISQPNDLKDLLNELYRICENKWKPFASVGMSRSELKIILDRTFNSWDLFVSRLKKKKWFLVDQISEYSYKKIFMANDGLKQSYDSL